MPEFIDLIEQGYTPAEPLLLIGTVEDSKNAVGRITKALTAGENVFEVELSNNNPRNEFQNFLDSCKNAINSANEGKKSAVVFNFTGNKEPSDDILIKLLSLLTEKDLYTFEGRLAKLDKENEKNLFIFVTKTEEVEVDPVLFDRLIPIYVSDSQYGSGDSPKTK